MKKLLIKFLKIKAMRKLKIAQIAPIWYPIPPEKYAGTEKIVYYLTEELVKRGHNVTLFASGNSKTSAKLISDRKRSLTEDKIPWEDIFLGLEHFAFSFKKIKESNFDIVHTHGGAKSIFFQNFIKTPLVYTSHGLLSPVSKKLPPLFEVLENYKEKLNMCFISEAQRKLCPVKFKNSWVVYNGIDMNLFRFNSKPENYFIWVGRVEPKKGVENAIKVAKIAKIKLYLVGKIDPEKEEYFQTVIKPQLSEKIKYLGELSQKRLVNLYRKAKALIFPLEWNEPFGLTMAESQACGTPVITFKFGSTPEVVKDKKTGFVVPFLDKNGKKNIEGILEAIKNIDKIRRENCRKFVEENFTLEKMIDNYEKIYYQLIK
jgi:glycosyltransferase involved in cell wall biosynthesis